MYRGHMRHTSLVFWQAGGISAETGCFRIAPASATPHRPTRLPAPNKTSNRPCADQTPFHAVPDHLKSMNPTIVFRLDMIRLLGHNHLYQNVCAPLDRPATPVNNGRSLTDWVHVMPTTSITHSARTESRWKPCGSYSRASTMNMSLLFHSAVCACGNAIVQCSQESAVKCCLR